MAGTVTLTPEQFAVVADAIAAAPPLRWISLTPGAEYADYVRVGFDAEWGYRHIDVAPDGTSADVNWGHSVISLNYAA